MARLKSSYADSKHWLHQAYERGFQAALAGEEDCPHVGLEKDWWEAGWSEGITYGSVAEID